MDDTNKEYWQNNIKG